MKKFQKVLFLVLAASVVSFSAPSHKLSSAASDFLKNRHAVNGHRLNYTALDKKDSYRSYVVNVGETTKTSEKLKKNLRGKFEVTELEKNVLEIKKEKYKIDISRNKESRFDCAQSILKALLPGTYANQFDLISIDTVRSFSMSQGVRDESYAFNFSRLYNNRIVRSANNYLRVDVERDGYLKGAQISMEDFSLTSEIVETDETFDENVAVLDSTLRTDFNSVKKFDDRDGSVTTVKTESVEAESAAASYCEVDSDDGKKLFPCIS